jgi:hypothetical protein
MKGDDTSTRAVWIFHSFVDATIMIQVLCSAFQVFQEISRTRMD